LIRGFTGKLALTNSAGLFFPIVSTTVDGSSAFPAKSPGVVITELKPVCIQMHTGFWLGRIKQYLKIRTTYDVFPAGNFHENHWFGILIVCVALNKHQRSMR
jgi:hypothetical protein